MRCSLEWRGSSCVASLHIPYPDCIEEAMDRLPQDPSLGIDKLGYNPSTMLAHLRAISLLWMGRVDEGVQWFQKAIERARQDHDLLTLGSASSDYGGMFSWVGDPQVALKLARQGAELAEKASGPELRVFAYAELGQAYH